MELQSPFEIHCSECYAYVPADSKFCPSCGFYLTKSQEISDKTSIIREGEKKFVSVLFVRIDLKIKEKEERKITEILESIIVELKKILQENSAYIDKYMEFKGIMAIFGIPHAHFDDPVNACKCAIKILSILNNKAKEIEVAHGVLKFGIGLNSGWVFSGNIVPHNFTINVVIGDTVNTAFRLSEKAKNQILITEEIAEIVKERIKIRHMGHFPIKGKEREIPVYEIKEQREEDKKMRFQIPFVGREKEIETFNNLSKKAKHGKGCVFILTGEGGSGKTTLKNVWIKRALSSGEVNNFFILEGEPPFEKENIPYAPFYTLLSEFFRKYFQEKPEKEKDFEQEYKVLQNINNKGNFFEEFLDPFSHLHRIRFFFKEFFEKLLLQKPVICIFDSLEKYDEVSLDLLGYLISSFNDKIFFLIIGRENLLVLKTDVDIMQYRIPPFTRDELNELCTQMFRKEISSSFIEELYSRTNGIPIYVSEFLRKVGRKGENLDSLPSTPPSLIGYILESYDSLKEKEKEYLAKLSILIRWNPNGPFGDFFPPDAKNIFDDLSNEEILIKENDEYRFANSLYRETIYQTILRKSKIPTHREVIKKFEANNNVPSIYSAYLFYHAYQGELWGKAIQFAILAAKHKFSQFSNKEALDYLLKAEEICSKTDEKTPLQLGDIMMEKAKVKRTLGFIDEAIRDLHNALVVLEGYIEKDEYEIARCYLGELYYEKNDYINAKRIFLKSFESLQNIKSHNLEINVHLGLGKINHALGHLPVALIEYNKAYQVKKSIGKEKEQKIYDIAYLLSLLHLEAGNLEMSLNYILQAEKNSELYKDYFWKMKILDAKVDCLYEIGNFKAALKFAEEGENLAKFLNNKNFEVNFKIKGNFISAFLGRVKISISSLENILNEETLSIKEKIKALLILAKIHYHFKETDKLPKILYSLIEQKEYLNRTEKVELDILFSCIEKEKGVEHLQSAYDTYKNIPSPIINLKLHIAFLNYYRTQKDRTNAERHLNRAKFILKELEERFVDKNNLSYFLLHPAYSDIR